MKSEEYLREIREGAGLKRAVLKKIVVEGRAATFFLVTDLTYAQSDIAYAESVSARYVPEGYAAKVDLVKSVPSPEGVRAAVMDVLKARFPAAAAFLSPSDVEVVTDGAGGRVFLSLGKEELAQFRRGDVLNVLSEELGRRFCGSWTEEFREVARKPQTIEREESVPEYVFAPRTFEVTHFEAIDGADVKTALYISDLAGEQQLVTFCGSISYIEERRTKNDKPFFTLTISDGSGQLRASYFTKKATLEKIRALKAGDFVCLTGSNEFFNGSLRFTAQKIDRGAPPDGFVPIPRPSRPVPAKYIAVTPEEIGDPVQSDLFGTGTLPEDLVKTAFVVFDLETTGLNYTPARGVMDHIIEIGAVKLKEGRICERFSTFVACPVRLSNDIISLTGIEDEMLVGAPEIKDVIADFFKFCDGCVLVGHNVQFDHGFVHYYGEREGYLFDQPMFDTIALAQEQLHLANYKLNTLADYYGFTFHHHRAFDDAFVTAKVFLELIRGRGSLPTR